LPAEPRLAAGLELVTGGTVPLTVASALGDWGRLNLVEVSPVFAWFIIIAVGGFTAFGYLSQTVAPSIATTFSYVNPIVAMTLGWALYGGRSPVGWWVIVIGVCVPSCR
jgi:drug/metabolite transporter (DMT)-like permease